jgi:hypothetical protein
MNIFSPELWDFNDEIIESLTQEMILEEVTNALSVNK